MNIVLKTPQRLHLYNDENTSISIEFIKVEGSDEFEDNGEQDLIALISDNDVALTKSEVGALKEWLNENF